MPTRNRPAELAATLSGLAAQEDEFGVLVSDQSDGPPAWEQGAVAGLVRILRHRGHPVQLYRNLPRLAEELAGSGYDLHDRDVRDERG